MDSSTDIAGWNAQQNSSCEKGNGSSKKLKELDVLLGKDSSVDGTFELAGLVRIDGQLTGRLVVDGELIIGETGKVEADIQARIVKVFGQVTGNIACSESLQLTGKASLKGDICSPRVTMSDGIWFQGRCVMTEDISPESEQIRVISSSSNASSSTLNAF